jgi:hypothetical protein
MRKLLPSRPEMPAPCLVLDCRSLCVFFFAQDLDILQQSVHLHPERTIIDASDPSVSVGEDDILRMQEFGGR